MNTTVRVLGSGAKPQLPGKSLSICKAKTVYLVAQNSSVTLVLHGKSAYGRKKFIFCPNYWGGGTAPIPTMGGTLAPAVPHSLRLWFHHFLHVQAQATDLFFSTFQKNRHPRALD